MKLKFLIFIVGFIFANENIKLNSLLFCIKENKDNILISNNNQIIKTNYKDLDNILNEIINISIEPWLPGASDKDKSNDIYLNKIFKLNFDKINNKKLENLKTEIEALSFIHSVEYEYLPVA